MKWRWTITYADGKGNAVVQVVSGDPRALAGRPLRCSETGTEYELTGIGLQKPLEYDAGIYMIILRAPAGAIDLKPGMTLVAGDEG